MKICAYVISTKFSAYTSYSGSRNSPARLLAYIDVILSAISHQKTESVEYASFLRPD